MTTTHNKHYKYLYGPVPSRRLGFSLGVDIIPYKICSFDCIYCQLGRTTKLTCNPETKSENNIIMSELKEWLDLGNKTDYITFAGSGEPTLNSGLADMINKTLNITDLPISIITNGSLLYNPDIRNAVKNVDLLLPSLDAGTEETFQKVNRPVNGLNFKMVVDGLVITRQEFQGEYWLEVMLVKSLNDNESEIEKMAKIIRKIDPDRVQINTVERPSRSGDVFAVSQETLDMALKAFGNRAEIIVSKQLVANENISNESAAELILNMLSRRPYTIDDISKSTGMHLHEITKYLQNFMSNGIVSIVGESKNPYYFLIGEQDESNV